VWACWKYIEYNPVRAGMVKRAGDYRFCSLGAWWQSGRHPFARHVAQLALPLFGMTDPSALLEQLRRELDDDAPEREVQGFSGTIKRRVRYWTDGWVIGSELFIRNVMAAHHTKASTHRLSRSALVDPPIYAWRKLRTT